MADFEIDYFAFLDRLCKKGTTADEYVEQLQKTYNLSRARARKVLGAWIQRIIMEEK